MVHLSLSLLLMTALGPSETGNQFDSYTKAYWAANAAQRPMLVILNPRSEAVSNTDGVSIRALQHQDGRLRTALQDYIVAEIDTATEHGQKVYELFGSPQLPRIVVIDDHQKKQLFRTSDHLQPATLSSILERYKDGAAATSFQAAAGAGSCPSCRARAAARVVN